MPAVIPAAQKYQSAAGDWSDQAFVCAGFSLSEPQYFAYQWQATSPSEGVAIAVADLDGNGAPDFHFEQPVSCTPPGSCTPGALVER